MVILDKIISDLKSKLPMGKKSKAPDNESDQNEEQDNSSQQGDATDNIDISGFRESQDTDRPKSLADKLKSKFSKDSAKAPSGSLDTKKKSKIIQIAVVVGLVIFLVSDYIIPPDEAPVAEVKLKPRAKPVKKTAPVPAEQPAVTENTETAVPETVASTETTPDSAVEVTSSTEPVLTEPAVTEPVLTEPAMTEPVLTEPAVTEPVLTEPAMTDTEPTAVDTSTATVDQIDDSGSPTVDEGNVTDQILQDLEKQANDTTKPEPKTEYTTPPDYDYRGRGLVYNCVGKHWACVDAPSYKTCEDNSSSVKFLNKKTECYPFNVYETLKGCQNMQNRMVSSSAKTSFCND